MNFLREIVSGKKKRMKDAGYNLDLTYVCPRVIGMSFPAEGLETTFRNNIKDVFVPSFILSINTYPSSNPLGSVIH